MFQSGIRGCRNLAGSHRHGIRHWATRILSWSRTQCQSLEVRLGFAGLRNSSLDNRQNLCRLLHLAAFEHEMAHLVLADGQHYPHYNQCPPDYSDIRSMQAGRFAMGPLFGRRMLGPNPSRDVGHFSRM